MSASIDDPLSEAWVAALVEASGDRSGPSGLVAITIGKTKRAVLDIVDGCVVADRSCGTDGDALEADEADVTVPVTKAQLGALIQGEESLAQAFMRGDVKPVGSTGPLLALVDLFEDDGFRARLAASA